MTTTLEPVTDLLGPDHARLREEARELAASFETRAGEVSRHLLDHRRLHPELWEAFRERGWPGLGLPGHAPAGGGGLFGTALVLEAFAAHGIVLWMPVLTTAIGHALAQAGPDALREEWLGRIAAGDALLALAATEPESGHNLFRARTEIRRDGDELVVNGRKRVTSGIDVADRVLVFGRVPRTADGPAAYTAVLVDPGAPGVTATELPMGRREGVRQFELDLVDVRVENDSIVGAEGQGLLALWPFTHAERILTAAICVGSAEYAVRRSVARASERHIAGRHPIGAQQAIAHPLAALHARVEATRLLAHRTAARLDAGTDGFAVAGEANLLKVLAADLVHDAADHAFRVFGADAYDEREGWVGFLLDARLARSAPVSQEFALNFVAEHVLGLPAPR